MGYIGGTPAAQALTSADITDGIIIDADIKADAAIALSKTALVAGTGITLATNTLNVDASQTGITSVGTIGTGVWAATDIAVAHGGTGASSLNNLITMGTHTTGNYVATITGGVGIDSNGATSGESVTHSLTLDLSELTDTAIANGDYIVFTDATDSHASVKGDLADVATLFAGTGLTASNSVLGVDASQSQITTVGALNAGSITSGFTSIDVGSGGLTTTGAIAGGTIDASTDFTIGGTVITDNTITDDGTLVIAASTATSFSDGNITNVGNIALDSISADATDMSIAVTDNSATALTVLQGTDAYLIVDTANSSESVSIGTGVSGTAINIGHGTSETTFGDNVTITGDLTINGATTTNATTNLTVADPLVKYGQAYVGSAYDQGFIVTRGNGSASNTQNMGFIWDESADEFATIKAATEDGATAGNVTVTDYVNLHVGAITADDTSVFSGSIELGHASDTTIARSGAGAITVEGTAVLLAGAQTGITSILATDLIIGEDAQTAIDFGTADEIDFKAANAARLTLTAATLYPVTTNQISLGTASLEFKDAFFDGTVTSDAFAGPLTGNVTGNASGTAATVTTGTQASITTLANVTTVGALGAGTIAAGFGAIDNGTSGIRTNTFTAETSIVPDAASGATLGTTSLEWGHIYIGDDQKIYLGDGQDVSLEYDEDGTDQLRIAGDTIFEDNVNLGDAANLNIGVPLLAGTDHTTTGMTAQMLAGGAIAAFDLVCIHTTTQEVVEADASAAATSRVIGIAPAAISDTATGTVLLQGFVRDDTWAWTTGGALYLSETAGAMTHTAPTTDGAFVQVVGVALSPDVVYINPSMDVIEHA